MHSSTVSPQVYSEVGGVVDREEARKVRRVRLYLAAFGDDQ